MNLNKFDSIFHNAGCVFKLQVPKLNLRAHETLLLEDNRPGGVSQACTSLHAFASFIVPVIVQPFLPRPDCLYGLLLLGVSRISRVHSPDDVSPQQCVVMNFQRLKPSAE